MVLQSIGNKFNPRPVGYRNRTNSRRDVQRGNDASVRNLCIVSSRSDGPATFLGGTD